MRASAPSLLPAAVPVLATRRRRRRHRRRRRRHDGQKQRVRRSVAEPDVMAGEDVPATRVHPVHRESEGQESVGDATSIRTVSARKRTA